MIIRNRASWLCSVAGIFYVAIAHTQPEDTKGNDVSPLLPVGATASEDLWATPRFIRRESAAPSSAARQPLTRSEGSGDLRRAQRHTFIDVSASDTANTTVVTSTTPTTTSTNSLHFFNKLSDAGDTEGTGRCGDDFGRSAKEMSINFNSVIPEAECAAWCMQQANCAGFDWAMKSDGAHCIPVEICTTVWVQDGQAYGDIYSVWQKKVFVNGTWKNPTSTTSTTTATTTSTTFTVTTTSSTHPAAVIGNIRMMMHDSVAFLTNTTQVAHIRNSLAIVANVADEMVWLKLECDAHCLWFGGNHSNESESGAAEELGENVFLESLSRNSSTATNSPTTSPTATISPTLVPSLAPTGNATAATADPTEDPTPSPTSAPTAAPTRAPTAPPTPNPTPGPTPKTESSLNIEFRIFDKTNGMSAQAIVNRFNVTDDDVMLAQLIAGQTENRVVEFERPTDPRCASTYLHSHFVCVYIVNGAEALPRDVWIPPSADDMVNLMDFSFGITGIDPDRMTEEQKAETEANATAEVVAATGADPALVDAKLVPANASQGDASLAQIQMKPGRRSSGMTVDVTVNVDGMPDDAIERLSQKVNGTSGEIVAERIVEKVKDIPEIEKAEIGEVHAEAVIVVVEKKHTSEVKGSANISRHFSDVLKAATTRHALSLQAVAVAFLSLLVLAPHHL